MANKENGPFIMLEVPNEITGKSEKKYVAIPKLLEVIWDDYMRGKISNEYCRGLLRDIQFTEAQVFHMLEWLQLGKAEFPQKPPREGTRTK